MHLLDISPWPFCSSVGGFCITLGRIIRWHFGKNDMLLLRLFLLFIVSFLWWSDVSYENLSGKHSKKVLRGFQFGMILFIVSEIFFFFSFFWGYFNSCVSPDLEIGLVWPPFGFKYIIIDPFSIPLLNTIVLLSSGVTITWCHHRLIGFQKKQRIISLFLTISLGVFFLSLQLIEYKESWIRINSGVYGSTFFILTGFHGFHVTVGTIFLIVSLLRLLNNSFTEKSHVSFELCAWYWHFVDVVWLFLYISIYWYGFI